jgi:hypothetical protein
MSREQSCQVTGTTLAILRQITSLGYVVSVHRLPCSLLGTIPGCVEMHGGDPRPDLAVIQIAKVGEHEEGDIEYRCACELARMVGIKLKG